jgi:hypothetical protein
MYIKKLSSVFFISGLFVLFNFSCKEADTFSVDVSDIDLKIKVTRFEKEIFKYKIDSSEFYITNYKNKFGEFFKLYNNQIIEIGDADETYYPSALNEFLNYWVPKEIPQILEAEFKSFDFEQIPAIESAYKHYKYYFPEKIIPEIYTYFSSFGYSVVTLDSIQGIGLDKYLGVQNFDIYDKVGYSQYQKSRMTKEMIPVDLIRSLAESDFPYEPELSDNLLDNMIYEGKMQYVLNCMLPKTADTLKWRYTGSQLNWANKHEKKIWNYLVEQKLLYSTDKSEIRKFVGDGPFTTVFTDVSAPRAGAFIGYKIVESYMKNNSDINLKTLLDEKNSGNILSKAKYNP